MLLFGISCLVEVPEQIKSDKAFVETELKPPVDFVKKFAATTNRLPTRREFYTWEREHYKYHSVDLTPQEDSLISGYIYYIRKKSDVILGDQYKFEKVDWRNGFAIGVDRGGDWKEYYFSWSDRYDTNNYSWRDGVIGLLIWIVIGSLPLLLWWLTKQWKKWNSLRIAGFKGTA